jgi:acyl-CoA thioester hydrolase
MHSRRDARGNSRYNGRVKKVVLEFEVYTFHIDFSGHVGNAVYVQWMEIARLRLLEAAGSSVPEMAKRRAVIPALTETQIKYRKPIFFGDRVRVEAWFSEVRFASAWAEYEFFNANGELVAAGRQKGAYLYRETQRPYRLTPEERALLEPYLHPAPDRKRGERADVKWDGG